MKKISVLTGSRADYGLLRPLLRALKEHPSFELDLIVTGMHLSRLFGYTVEEIELDGFHINTKIKNEPDGKDKTNMAWSIGKAIIGIANYLELSQPDLFLVLGDRAEVLAGVIAATYQNIIVVHLCGGDSSWGGLDESARHAITKLSHIHFPTTCKSKERILKLGEDEWRIFQVGLTGLDELIHMDYLSEKEFENTFNIKLSSELILLIQHPITTEPNNAKKQITETLEAVKELGIQTVIIYPNSDTGGKQIITQIKKYESLSHIKSYPNISRTRFLNLMKYASVLIGNSSSGMTEAASFHLPVVNIGSRQIGRERGENVIDVDYDKNQIIDAIKKALYDDEFKKMVRQSINPYGDGKSVQRIINILENLELNVNWIKKKITF